MLAQSLAALNASPGNAAGDASLSQVSSASLEVVAFVSMQLRGPFTGSSWQACNRRNRVHTLLEHLGVMPVRTADQNHQRDASGIYNDVSLGAELAPVRRVGPRFLTPRGLGTEEPAMLARLQSIWSCSRKKVFPWNTCLQHEQDAIEGSFIADCELARTAFGRRHEGWDKGLQLLP